MNFNKNQIFGFQNQFEFQMKVSSIECQTKNFAKT